MSKFILGMCRTNSFGIILFLRKYSDRPQTVQIFFLGRIEKLSLRFFISAEKLSLIVLGSSLINLAKPWETYLRL